MPSVGRQVPVHYLRGNHGCWTPPAVISFDTETVSHMAGTDEVMTMRLWCARFTDRRAPKHVEPVESFDSGSIPEDMAYTFHQWTRRRRTVWAYAHNLGFDLSTSLIVPGLVNLGWEVTEFAINAASPWVRLKQGDHRLTLCDSWSWLNAPLAKVADVLGMVKPALPDSDDSNAAWLERCTADTNILHTAMLTLMDWWDDEQLGNWNVTGSASGFNAMRHIPGDGQILIRPDDDECSDDRKAIYGGRRYVWKTGTYPAGYYTEVDIEKAYTSVCRYLPLPVGRQARFGPIPTDHKWLSSDRWGVIADCLIRTDVPSIPVRARTGVWYSVGEFRTTLAGPDIKAAVDAGSLVQIYGGWLHRLGTALAPWAAWCLWSIAVDNTSVPDLAKMVHRHWARSVVGKWNQRGFEQIHLGPSPNDGWDFEEAWHHGKNVPAGIVDFSGERYQVAATGQSDSAYPAILAWVESYVRVALNRACDIVGTDSMACCDTDGFICRLDDAVVIDAINEAIAPFRVRPKRHFTNITIIGPQHMTLDREKRMSGIPSSARPAGNGTLKASVWPKYSWQLANGRTGSYVRPEQAYKLAATYAPGWVLADGTVVPVEMRLDASGANEFVPWPETRYAVSGAALGPHQNRHLERYVDG